MMRATVVCLLWAVVALCGRAEVVDALCGVWPVTDVSMRQSLNGVWNLKVVEGIAPDDGIPPVDSSWGRIPVPGCWEAYGFCKPRYDAAAPLTGYYQTTFRVPHAWKGKRVILRFDGVLYAYDVWVNGRKAGSWASAYNTAQFDITPFLDKRATEQLLQLRVVTQAKGSDFDYNDDWAPSGIFRDVQLMAVPDIHLSDLTIRTTMQGGVSVRSEVANADRKTRVVHDICDADGKLLTTLEAPSGTECSTMVAHPHLWTAETPYLYQLRTRIVRKGRVVQTFTHRFGIRELTIEGNLLKLNGKPIKLRGVTCHSTDPQQVKVVSEELTLKDMRLMKEASVNYIRTSHYPREPRFYELADSLGFYVIDEVPFGYGDKHLSDSTYNDILRQRAQATIRRDKNHASVLIWSLGNENPLTVMCQQLGEYVKQHLDSSRPICYPQVGSYFRRFNYDFPAVADLYAPHYPTTSQIATFYQRADRPVIFTEYCHTLGISLEDHDRQWEIIERTPCIAGGSVWEWVDQGMPFRTADGKPRDNDCYGYEEKVYTSATGGFEMYGNKGTDGLLYANRVPLPNYYELQHNYARAAVCDSVLHVAFSPAGEGCAPLNIRNRYDFLNLRDNVFFRWALTADRDTLCHGSFSPDCQPRSTTVYRLPLQVKGRAEGRVLLLQVAMSDKQGHVFNRQSVPVNPVALMPRMLAGLSVSTASPHTLMQEGFMVRAGRKATMAERLKVGDRRLERYLLRLRKHQQGVFVGGDSAFSVKACINEQQAGNTTHVSFTLTPDTTDTFLSEFGLAMLLDQRIDRVQWIGQGPLPTYPGRYRAGRYGFWALQQGDLYFEGNRMGVDAALLTDRHGDGLLLVCRQGCVSFEQTDRGLVVSYNVAVAGQGPKFARTAFPVVAKTLGEVKGDFYLYRVNGDHLPELLRDLFVSPSAITPPYRPFLTQYDTYLMRFEDVVRP